MKKKPTFTFYPPLSLTTTADSQARLSRVMATAPSSSWCRRTKIYEIKETIPKKTYILRHPSSPFAFLVGGLAGEVLEVVSDIARPFSFFDFFVVGGGELP